MRPEDRRFIRGLACSILIAAVFGAGLFAALTVPLASSRAQGEQKPYTVKDGKVDKATYNGWRRYTEACLRCHGPDGAGSSYAPSMVDSLKQMSEDQFKEIVAEKKGGMHFVLPHSGRHRAGSHGVGGDRDGAGRRGILVAFENLALGQDDRRLDLAGVVDDDTDDARVAGPSADLAFADDRAVHDADEDAVAALEKAVMDPAQLEAHGLALQLRERGDAVGQPLAEIDEAQDERHSVFDEAIRRHGDVGVFRPEQLVGEILAGELMAAHGEAAVRMAELVLCRGEAGCVGHDGLPWMIQASRVTSPPASSL
jgi:mono/diheme cytochrome c family protein